MQSCILFRTITIIFQTMDSTSEFIKVYYSIQITISKLFIMEMVAHHKMITPTAQKKSLIQMNTMMEKLIYVCECACAIHCIYVPR